MPAKPQQMSDSQEKSDDLIAELAKLMASNAQGTESEAKPTVIKLAPLSAATVPSPAPIRIPGMEVPVAPAVPTVRIPGLEKPVGINEPAAAPQAKAQPVTSADVSKPAPAAPTITLEPLASWQSREAPKPVPAASGWTAAPISVPAPAPQVAPTPPSAAPQAEARLSAQVPRSEPNAAVAPAPSPAQTEARPAASARTDVGFDFGFSSNGGGGKFEASPHKPAVPTAPEHDPIADLIAAELDAAQAEPAKSEAPGAGDPKPAPAFPASVNVVPARNFGNATAGQAPVLVAKPVAAAPRATPIAPLAFRPLSPAPKPAESDKFAVAPAFGLGGKPAPVAATPVAPQRVAPAPVVHASPAPMVSQYHTPKPDSDPMDEIENLIGEAVRVQLSASDQTAPAKPAPAPAAPVVPPLNTGFAPRRAGLKDNEPQVRSAEAAILAAAAATGAEVGRIEPRSDDDRPYKRVKAKPEKTMFGGARQYVGMAVAGTLLLAAGLGLYWVLGMGRGDTTAPVLTADTTPAKQVPAVTAAEAAQPARSVVFDEIDGVAAVDSAETLVSRDETAGASIADVASVMAPKATESTESGLANRKVRTVTVRPDGTIVSGDEAVAGTEALPVERPNVPEVPGAATEPSDLLTAAVASDSDAALATDPAPSTNATAELDPIAAAIAGETAEAPAPLEAAALAPTDTVPPVFDASIVAPTPMPRPTDRNALNAGSAEIDTGAAAAVTPRAPASTPLVALTDHAPAATPSSGGAAAYVQLSAQLTEADARAAVRRAQSRWGSLFNGGQLIVQRADLGAKGIRYRVRLPTSSLQQATQICASIKADGGDCYATNG